MYWWQLAQTADAECFENRSRAVLPLYGIGRHRREPGRQLDVLAHQLVEDENAAQHRVRQLLVVEPAAMPPSVSRPSRWLVLRFTFVSAVPVTVVPDANVDAP